MKQQSEHYIIGKLFAGLILFLSSLLQSSICLARTLTYSETEPAWVICRDILFQQAGIQGGIDARSMSSTLQYEQSFVKLILAVAYVESGFQSGAVSGQNARGLMQLTDSAMQDLVRRECKYNIKSSLFNADYNIACGSCYLRSLYAELGDWVEVLIVYNSGYQGLTAYRNGSNVPNETSQYLLRINHALSMCNTARIK